MSLLSEEKKRLFLDLCKYAARSDDFFSPKQRMIIEIYCNEMNIVGEDIDHCQWELDYILDTLQKTLTYYEKREITIEIIALLLSNRRIDPAESEFLQHMADVFGIEEKTVDEMIHATLQMIDAQEHLLYTISTSPQEDE